METNGRRKSSNVDDRRGMSPKKMGGIGGGIGIIIIIIFTLLSGGDLGDVVTNVVNNSGGTETTEQVAYTPTAEEEARADFVSVVLADTEDIWNKLFQEQGMQYVEPTLVLFTDSVSSACGLQSAAVVPFY